jgi:antitoxin ParD1/3/4
MSDEFKKCAAKLEHLRQDIRDGLVSGASTALDIEEVKARGRKRLAAQQGEE